MKVPEPIRKTYCCFTRCATSAQPVMLLLVRLAWGFQFFQAGLGKLRDISGPVAFFTKLGIPLPEFNAWVVGITECAGGLLLMIGLFSRLVSIPLLITMVVAYLTADLEAVKHLFSHPTEFLDAAPFTFLMATALVIAFGPGKLSADYAIDKWLIKRDQA